MTPDDCAGCLDAAVAGVQARGKAEPGDKTMIDALLPAGDALRRRSARARASAPRSGASAAAGEEGMEAPRSRSSPARDARATWVSAAQGTRTPAPRRAFLL